MKVNKGIVWIAGLMMSLIVISYFVLGCIRYHKIGIREPHACALNSDLKKQIEIECLGLDDFREIIRRCDRLVGRNLSFAYKNHLSEGKANCIGYAQLTSDALNYAFHLNHLPYKAYPVYGRAHLFGYDVHPFVMSIMPSKFKAFFKDHDYVEILLDGKVRNVDSSFRDLLGIEYNHIVESL